MDTIHFLGRVFPHAVQVTTGYEPTITFTDSRFPGPMDFIVHIKDSAVDVECRVDKFDPANSDQFTVLHNAAFDLARAAVDLVAFSTGSSLTTIFEHLVDAKGVRSTLWPHNPALGNICTAYGINALPSEGNKRFDEIYKIVLSNVELFMALRDLTKANTVPHIGIINCGRVLDGIRRMISPGLELRKAWAAMQAVLNISESYQKWVSELSAHPRHADRSFINGVDTQEAIRRTWMIMNRFLECKRRGNVALTEPEFPLLTQ